MSTAPLHAWKTFRIDYVDPDTGETKSVTKEFEDSAEFPARLWADDYGYMLADKGQYTITELP